jgi:hypothetical protein
MASPGVNNSTERLETNLHHMLGAYEPVVLVLVGHQLHAAWHFHPDRVRAGLPR